jgi:sortase A
MMLTMKAKYLGIALLALALMASSASPVMAADYNFSTGYESDTFGGPTTSDVPPDYSHIENVRRDKNSAYFPPAYGVFSGDIPTEPTSKYHEQDKDDASITSYNNTAYYAEDTPGGFLTPTSSMMNESDYANLNNQPGSANVYADYSGQSLYHNHTVTSVDVNSDGSIGRLSIPELDLNVKVYENTDLDTMKRGVGHFSFTSQWDGNVGLASHNRGSASYFKGIWNLDYGDKIVYTTSEGTRAYYVDSKQKIDENDLSYLNASDENMLSLITCVENQSGYRWLIRAVE